MHPKDGMVSMMVEGTFAEDLPVKGRSFQNLIMVARGAVISNAHTICTQSLTICVATTSKHSMSGILITDESESAAPAHK
jgi:hypothetical protein